MIYEILTYGHPALRKKAEPVTDVSGEIRELAADLLSTMRRARGLGLAASQVGRPEAVCVIEVPPNLDVREQGGTSENPDVSMPLVMINPELVYSLGVQEGQEGCLSFPEIFITVKRPYEVAVRYLDIKGRTAQVVGRGLLARAIMHEMEHLAGVLLVDHMSPVQKLNLAPQLRKLKKAAKKNCLKQAAAPGKTRK